MLTTLTTWHKCGRKIDARMTLLRLFTRLLDSYIFCRICLFVQWIFAVAINQRISVRFHSILLIRLDYFMIELLFSVASIRSIEQSKCNINGQSNKKWTACIAQIASSHMMISLIRNQFTFSFSWYAVSIAILYMICHFNASLVQSFVTGEQSERKTNSKPKIKTKNFIKWNLIGNVDRYC